MVATNEFSNAALFKNGVAALAGQWIGADNGASFSVRNPATGEVIAHVPDMGRHEALRAIEHAVEAQKAWRARPAKERSRALNRWAENVRNNHADLAQLITLENGKPLAEAKGEVAYANAYIEWFAEEAKRVYGEIIPAANVDRRLLVIKQPIGVCAAITPWNFPAAMVTRKVAAALAAGCAMILKPAEQTPLSALAWAQLAYDSGIPPGVLQIITGEPVEIGRTLCESDSVRKISFTGSTEVGRLLMRHSADTLKKLSLELGGHAPFIVFQDADVEAAVEGALASKYRNAGQTCVCANRFFVHADVYDRFAERLTEESAKLRIGNGFEAGVSIGPLIDETALEKVSSHVRDAVRRGARILTGGSVHALGGNFYTPTVLSEVGTDAQIFSEETFGPVAPLFRFRDEAEVVDLANRSQYGLAAYFYSRDIGRVWRVAEALEYGMVGINTGTLSAENAPFGGIKQSGFGREGSHYGIEEYLEIKYLCMAGL